MLKRSLGLWYGSLTAIAACGDAVAPQADLQPAQFCRRIDSLYAAFGRPFATIDDVWEGMSLLLPGGFAGALQDTTMLVWPSDSAAMRKAASWGRRCFASAQFPWEHALFPTLYFVQFSWAQLADYKWRYFAVSRHHEHLLDIDERQNLLRIGVITEEARQLVLEDLARASIPLKAVVVDIVPPVIPLIPPSAVNVRPSTTSPAA